MWRIRTNNDDSGHVKAILINMNGGGIEASRLRKEAQRCILEMLIPLANSLHNPLHGIQALCHPVAFIRCGMAPTTASQKEQTEKGFPGFKMRLLALLS